MNNTEKQTAKDVYTTTKRIVDERIKDGSLPKAYKFPAYSYFEESFNNLRAQKKNIPDFQYVFVPMGLKFTEWDTLLKKTGNDEWHNNYLAEDLNTGSGWELWLVSGADKSKLPLGLSKEQAVEQKQPIAPLQVYLAQNWLRLETGQKPVDQNSWSICEEDVLVGGVLRSVFSCFGSISRGADSFYDDRDVADDDLVVRLSARGTDSALDASSVTPSSSDLQANTEALDRLTDTLKEIYHGRKLYANDNT